MTLPLTVTQDDWDNARTGLDALTGCAVAQSLCRHYGPGWQVGFDTARYNDNVYRIDADTEHLIRVRYGCPPSKPITLPHEGTLTLIVTTAHRLQ